MANQPLVEHPQERRRPLVLVILLIALERVTAARLVFGSDNPPVPFPLRRSLDHIDELDLTADERAAVLGANARALFERG